MYLQLKWNVTLSCGYLLVGRHSKIPHKLTKQPIKIEYLKKVCRFQIMMYLCSLIQTDNKRHVNRIQHREFPFI